MFSGNIMSIAICDDSDTDRSILESLLTEYLEAHQLSFSINLYSSGNDLMNNLKYYDLLFLDVELGDANGIELLRALEKTSMVWRLFITTSYDHYLIDSFGVRTAGFLHKPVKKPTLSCSLDRTLHDYLLCNTFIYTFDKTHSVQLKDILYLKSTGPYIDVFTVKEHFTVTLSTKNLFAKVNTSLIVQIGRGLYVNIANVIDVTEVEVTLRKDVVLSIGKKFRNDFLKAISMYMHDKMITTSNLI